MARALLFDEKDGDKDSKKKIIKEQIAPRKRKPNLKSTLNQMFGED